MTAVLALPAVLDLRAAGSLKTDLLALRGRPVVLEAGAVERLGGLCLQILLAARNTWAADGHSLTVGGDAGAFSEQWAAFGAPPLEPAPPGEPA